MRTLFNVIIDHVTGNSAWCRSGGVRGMPIMRKQSIFALTLYSGASWREVEWVLLDDGYCFYGRLVDAIEKFSGGVKTLLQSIKAAAKNRNLAGSFIAQPESALFQQHPDWFERNHQGQP
ncbi:hypothetical protein ACT691_01275 [Vibrio metschnikovii]